MKELIIKGAKLISKNEQRLIKGGKEYCGDGAPCHEGYYCNGTWCVPYPINS